MEIEKIENIDRLIANYLAGKATEEEIVILNSWIKASKSNYKYFHQIQNIWDTLNPDNLISDEGIMKAFKKVEYRISGKEKSYKLLHVLQRIAAIAIIPLVIGGFLIGRIAQNHDLQSPDNVVYNEVKAAYGTRSSLLLSDGSSVWLNSGSTLRYPVKFANTERIVLLTGEAYFEVHSNKASPFIVQTKNLNVKATGTKFNVRAFSSSHLTEVALQEGKVEIFKTDKNKKYISIQKMIPNQHLSYDSVTEQSNLNEEDVYKYIAWKDGKLIFRNESLPDVAQKLSLLYNVDIELKGNQIKEYRYWATFHEESLINILKFLKVSSPIDYKDITAKPLKDGTFPKKKYIIFQTGK